jgi:predicted DNA-binding transcriptional regulator YafY
MNRLIRLQRLRGLLASGEHATASALGAALGVSVRTVMRDLTLLRDEGLFIEADQGRGGGVRLARGHAAGGVQLTTAEAMALLVSLAVAEKLSTPLVEPAARAARQKIAAVFARPERERIRALRRRVLVGAPASARVLNSYRPERVQHANEIRRAFFEQKLLSLAYCDEKGARTRRTVEPHFLYLNPPAWYLLAWDELRAGVRAFRFDRIGAATVLERSFRLRNAAEFLAAAEAGVGAV